jgi:hypothetical protein
LKSSSHYLKRFFPNSRWANFDIVGGAGNTLSVVERAIQLNQDAKRERRPYIHTWCVFDRDDHPPGRFNDAIQVAQSQKNFTAIWSNEAFELWYLLHFDYHQSSLSRHELNRKLTSYLGKDYSKSDESVYDRLMQNDGAQLDVALKNAERLMSDRRSPQRNPSLNVHVMIRRILQIKEGLGEDW